MENNALEEDDEEKTETEQEAKVDDASVTAAAEEPPEKTTEYQPHPSLPTHTDVNPFSLAGMIALAAIGIVFLAMVCYAAWRYILSRTSRTEDERERHRANIARMTDSVNV